MHFVIHTQYYPPEIGAPQARLYRLACGLIKRGHRVTILTAMPNYPEGIVHEGYGGWCKIDELDGTQIIRCWIYPFKGSSFIKRLLNYFSFVLSSFLLGLTYVNRADFVLTESPPLFLGISGYLLSLIKRARWIFNVSDLWPESALRLGMVKNGLFLWLSYKQEEFFYRKAWCVSGQSQEILHNILARFPGTQTRHFSNGADTDLFKPENTRSNKLDPVGEGIIGLYAGLHGLAQGLDHILRAVGQLKEEHHLKIVFVGTGPLKKSLMALAGDLELENITFLDPLPRQEMPGVLASADFCIVPLGMDLPGAVPSKLYEAMSAGKPVLLMASGEAAQIVRDSNCGLVVASGDLAGLTSSFEMLVKDGVLREQLGANGRSAVLRYFDSHEIVEKFILFLESHERS